MKTNTHKQIQSAVEEFRKEYGNPTSLGFGTWKKDFTGLPPAFYRVEQFLTKKLEQLAKQKDEEFLQLVSSEMKKTNSDMLGEGTSQSAAFNMGVVDLGSRLLRIRAELRNKLQGGKDGNK